MTKSIPTLYIFTSLFLGNWAGLVRVPKIYNAIVSSKQNLSPSQAVPIIEPVYGTSALGVLFPPTIVHTIRQHPIQAANNNEAAGSTISENQNTAPHYHDVRYHGPLYPVIDPYLAYTYHNNLLAPTLPVYQRSAPTPISKPAEAGVDTKEFESTQQNVKAAIDFKKNPEVPDVPIPPLPVRNKTPTQE